jgi:hypothetical protein
MVCGVDVMGFKHKLGGGNGSIATWNFEGVVEQ